MTTNDAGRVVRAGLLELMPERTCAGCDARVDLPGTTEVRPLADRSGTVILFFCDECGMAPERPKAVA